MIFRRRDGAVSCARWGTAAALLLHHRAWRLVPQVRACSSTSARGRLVLNHSTHVEGLIPVLRRVASIAGVHTVVPGRLATARCAADGLQLRVTTRVPGGFKVLARRGTAVQEVFIAVNAGGPYASTAVSSADGVSILFGRDDDHDPKPLAFASALAEVAGDSRRQRRPEMR